MKQRAPCNASSATRPNKVDIQRARAKLAFFERPIVEFNRAVENEPTDADLAGSFPSPPMLMRDSYWVRYFQQKQEPRTNCRTRQWVLARLVNLKAAVLDRDRDRRQVERTERQRARKHTNHKSKEQAPLKCFAYDVRLVPRSRLALNEEARFRLALIGLVVEDSANTTPPTRQATRARLAHQRRVFAV